MQLSEEQWRDLMKMLDVVADGIYKAGSTCDWCALCGLPQSNPAGSTHSQYCITFVAAELKAALAQSPDANDGAR